MAWLMRLTLIAPLVFGFGCGDGGGKEKKSGKAGGEPAAAMKSGPAAPKPAPKPAKAPPKIKKRPDDDEARPRVEMKTSMGVIVLELDRRRAPITVENFLRYVEAKFYDGTLFHRVRPAFMIQGGGYTPEKKRKKGKRDPIRNESADGLTNARGTIAMARAGDPDSATSQFFINVVNNGGALDYPNADGHGYAVFGKVTKGMDVVDKIRNVKTEKLSERLKDCPVKDVVIESVRRL